MAVKKLCVLSLCSLSCILIVLAQAGKAPDGAGEKPRYVSEAPLPKGWPAPGPYDVVVVKQFPAYRAAYTKGRSSTFAFWRLFNHIKRKEIPMTAPVELGMGPRGGKGQKLGMNSMGFLYQHDEVGNQGMDGSKVEVRDMPAMRALSYTWQGRKDGGSLRKAKMALDAALKQKGWKSADYRVLGYNGPRTPDEKKTWEMLLVLPRLDAAKP